MQNISNERRKPFQFAKQPPYLPEINKPYNWEEQVRYISEDIDTVVAYSYTTQTFGPGGKATDRDKD